jgi:HD-like signal output (HDOD) protein
VLNKTAFNIQIRRDPTIERQPLQFEAPRELPDTPVTPVTLLLLDLLVQEPCIDLREMSELVLADLGATLQILRMAGREYGTSENRPVCIADCIVDLGLRNCLTAVSAETISRQERKSEVAELWSHSREIARCSRLVAQEMAEIDPEEAYLTGLLHEIGLLPTLLGWGGISVADESLVGLRLANRWSLPSCVREFFSETHLTRYPTRWSAVVSKAHLLANRSTPDYSFDQELRPRLHRAGQC